MASWNLFSKTNQRESNAILCYSRCNPCYSNQEATAGGSGRKTSLAFRLSSREERPTEFESSRKRPMHRASVSPKEKQQIKSRRKWPVLDRSNKYLTQLLSVAEGAIGSRRHHRSDKIDALDTELAIEWIFGQDVQSKAMRMAEIFRHVFTLWSAARNSTSVRCDNQWKFVTKHNRPTRIVKHTKLENWNVSDVVVNKLTKLHQQHCCFLLKVVVIGSQDWSD